MGYTRFLIARHLTPPCIFPAPYALSRIEARGPLDLLNGGTILSSTFRHPSFDRLIDLAEGRVSPDERASVLTHVSGCPRCTTEVAQLERLIGLMRADRSEDAPSHVVARAVRLFNLRSAPSRPSIRQRLLATLQFDSAWQPAAMGVRSASTQPRQLLFSDGEHVFDVRITAAGAEWTMAGQVLGPVESGRVDVRGPAGAFHTELNEMGEFTLQIPPGTYALLVTLADVEVEIPTLKIGD